MSIAVRVVPFSRSVRTLIKIRADMAKHIKDLKDLKSLRVAACYRHSGPTDLKRTRNVFSVGRAMARDRPSPYAERGLFSARSAGACPPRSLDRCGKRPHPRDYGCLLCSPGHGEGQALALR